jgi:two-component system, OmpR family, response regulator
MRILLVEDDQRVAAHIARSMSDAGHTVDHIADGREALFRVAAERYDVAILDRMLPNVDGLTILKTMRANRDRTPVLVLSALDQVDERVQGLKAGGDDYLVKPFAVSELAARIEALGRRAEPAGDLSALKIGDLEIDLATRTVRRGGREIAVTDREFRILDYMARNAGRVVTRSMLLENVWKYNFDPQTNIIDQHVSRLRQKLDRGFETPLLHTVRGVGYVLRAGGSRTDASG